MHHYVALSWRPNNTSAALEALRLSESLKQSTARWDVAFQSATLRVYSRKPVDAAMRAYVLPDDGGVIFGRLFRSASPDIAVNASELDGAQLVGCRGRTLLQEYWGAYVAILHSREQETVLVIRDCSGRIPCYYSNVAGLYVFFSDIADIEPFGVEFTINRYYLASYIHHHPLHIRETGLREVSELLAGEGVSMSSEGISHQSLWDPRLIATGHIIDDYTQAKSELEAVTEQVVGLWASLYNGILLKLSGGLDSAIVLGCLKRMSRSDCVVCINQYTEGTEDDERAYARSAAEMAGVRLIELPRVSDARVFVEKLYSVPQGPNPDFHKAAKMLAIDGTNEIAERYNCDTVWTGQGGDHVFLQTHTAYSAVDYLMHHRIPYHLPPILYDTAVLSRQSLWSVLNQTLRYSCRTHPVLPDPFGNSGETLMTPSSVAELPERYTAAPWHDESGRLPPGKQIQIDTYLDLLNRHKPVVPLERPYECHPLVSQPLLELSLRIPTYHLLRGGRQRAMARAAFADRVPLCILSREDKGSVRDQVRTLLRGSCDLLRQTLLEGTLVSLGIIDRSSLERIIVTQETFRPAEVFALIGCLAVEIWAMHWTKQAAQVAAS